MASFHKHNKLSDGRRPECKECSKKRNQEKAANDPYTSTLNKMADNILKRTKYAINKPKNKTYLVRGIKCLLGDSRNEIREMLDKHYGCEIKKLLHRGQKPSVDRIDPYGHYELGNIQIVSLEENLSRIDHKSISKSVRVTFPDGEQKVFESISDASKELGCKRDTIYASLKRPGINRRGLIFELVS
ncbi:NUMOD1 domain-containing DNA-binding protein [Robertmurraya andreesenii]|uniref:Nuclease-associated modular DNA-binding 1 domain-containing protein n=1 Tax=Anoxybacillus andreesenii TaxID=1325932 RepID=A0ABT9V210_9BACL|nr:NUMOD1 domain-containing DNA-binding protein [Robertmurraya andreesenii]MDQ0154951.1 hypothetical protein [Robertmurraya andreesenii]